MVAEGEAYEFYLPSLDDAAARCAPLQAAVPTSAARSHRLDVVVRKMLMPAKHLQVLLIRGGECLDVGFTDKHGRISFCGLEDGCYTVRMTSAGKVVEKKGEVKEDMTCRIAL